MGVWAGMAVMAAAGTIGAFNSANAAKAQAETNIAKFQYDEIQRVQEFADQSWFQVLSNAERYARNKSIAKEALSVREKTKFWNRVRFENATSEMSNSMRQAYDTLDTQLSGRMSSKSATTRAILRSSMQNYYKARDTMNVNQTLQNREVDESYRRTLGTRDFGFTPIARHTPGQYFGADPSSAYKTALIAGITGTAASVGSAYVSSQNRGSAGAPADPEG